MGLSRLSALDPKPQIIRYEKSAPGEMIHIDIKKLGRIEGIGHRITGDRVGQSNPRALVVLLHVFAMNRHPLHRNMLWKTGWKRLGIPALGGYDHSRLASLEILPDEKRASCLTFLFNALRFFKRHGVHVKRVMSDNRVSFRAHLYAKA